MKRTDWGNLRIAALTSPEDLQKACAAFERLRLPLRLRKFDSGLLVVQSNILFMICEIRE